MTFYPGETDKVFDDIADERKRQYEKWGLQTHDNYKYLAILGEEFGELAQAILHDEFGGGHAGTAEKELLQLVAVGVQWLELYKQGLR